MRLSEAYERADAEFSDVLDRAVLSRLSDEQAAEMRMPSWAKLPPDSNTIWVSEPSPLGRRVCVLVNKGLAGAMTYLEILPADQEEFVRALLAMREAGR